MPHRIPQEKNYFQSQVAQLIHAQQEEILSRDQTYYYNVQFLTFVWKFPLSIVKTTKHWFVEGVTQEKESKSLSLLLHFFYEIIDRSVRLLSTQFVLKKLNSQELLRYLNYCITGDWVMVSVPPDGCFIDTVLSRSPLMGGYVPCIANKYIYVISIIGYLNEETISGVLSHLGTYPLLYRWSNRFIVLGENTAAREMKRYQRHWHNKVKGLFGILKEVVFGAKASSINFHALKMEEQVNLALTENSTQTKRFGYWSSEVVLMHEDQQLLHFAKKDIAAYLEQCGFSCVQEDINALDAWFGTIPGHGSCNMRRVFVDSIHLAHVLPLHTTWTGALCYDSASLMPKNAPPVFYATTVGKTLFRFYMDVSDVGHQVIIGPTGSGKSTYLGFLIAQFLKYKNAQIFVFDKDYSHHALSLALDGKHYDIGRDENLYFCPLADLSTESKKICAKKWIEDLILFQHHEITADLRDSIHRVIEVLSDPRFEGDRNLSVFCSFVQDQGIRTILKYYTVEGTIKLLDATNDSLKKHYLKTFEMNWLLSQKSEIYLPILQHIFNHIEQCIELNDGLYPTLIVLEEAWFYMSHPFFSNTLKDWLKTLRKKNARVVFATQSLADLYDAKTQSLTEVTAAIMESCLTKIFLPHKSMEVEIIKLYRKMGLSDRQIDIISRIAIPKKHYYVVTPLGKRLIYFNWQESTLALLFIGLSKKKSKKLLTCIEQHDHQWVYFWLKENGEEEWAEYFLKNIRTQ